MRNQYFWTYDNHKKIKNIRNIAGWDATRELFALRQRRISSCCGVRVAICALDVNELFAHFFGADNCAIMRDYLKKNGLPIAPSIVPNPMQLLGVPLRGIALIPDN